MYCYHKVLPSFLDHVGNEKELKSIVNHGLISRGVSLKTGRQAVFFTIVNPMDDEDGLRETLCDLSHARFAPYRDTVRWCNLKLAQQRGLQFYQTKPNAVILYDTLPAELLKSELHEDQGSALPLGKRDSKTAYRS